MEEAYKEEDVDVEEEVDVKEEDGGVWGGGGGGWTRRRRVHGGGWRYEEEEEKASVQGDKGGVRYTRHADGILIPLVINGGGRGGWRCEEAGEEDGGTRRRERTMEE